MDNLPSLGMQAAMVLPPAIIAAAIAVVRGWARPQALEGGPPRLINLGLLDVAGAMACMIVGLLLTGPVIGWLGITLDDAGRAMTPLDAALGGLVGQMLVGGLACSYVLVRCALEPQGLREVGMTRGPLGRILRVAATGLILGTPMVLGLGAALGLVMSLLGLPLPPVGHDMLIVLQDSTRPVEIAVIVAGAVLIAPLFEEILFRGLLQTAIGNLLGPAWRWTTILLCSLLFAVIHGGAGVPPHGLAALVLLAIVVGWTYERTGSLWPAILIHAGFNTVNITLVLLLTAPA